MGSVTEKEKQETVLIICSPALVPAASPSPAHLQLLSGSLLRMLSWPHVMVQMGHSCPLFWASSDNPYHSPLTSHFPCLFPLGLLAPDPDWVPPAGRLEKWKCCRTKEGLTPKPGRGGWRGLRGGFLGPQRSWTTCFCSGRGSLNMACHWVAHLPEDREVHWSPAVLFHRICFGSKCIYSNCLTPHIKRGGGEKSTPNFPCKSPWAGWHDQLCKAETTRALCPPTAVPSHI